MGLKTAVAPQGTSITEGQLALLRRYHPQIECFFDSDAAGQNAAQRLLPMALKAGIEVRFLRLAGASKVDPDLLFLERGLAAYEELRQGSLSAMAFACRAALPEGEAVSAEQKSRAAHGGARNHRRRRKRGLPGRIHPRGRGLPAGAGRRPGKGLFPPERPRGAVRFGPDGGPSVRGFERAHGPSAQLSSAGTPEQDLLTVCLHYERVGKALSTALPHPWIDPSRPAGVLLNRFLDEFEHDNWPGRDHLDALLETAEEKALVASLLFDAPRFDDPVEDRAGGVGEIAGPRAPSRACAKLNLH